jgi:ATP-dependent Lon protease
MVDDPTLNQDLQDLKSRVEVAQLPVDLREKIDHMLRRFEQAMKFGTVFEEYERVSHYIDWVCRLPWNTFTVDNLDTNNAKAVLDQHHYGLDDVKERLLEFLTVLKLNHDRGATDHIARAPILLLVGLVGTGKTTFAYSLAEALNRKIVRIPFGSMGSALDLRGQSRLHLEAEPGYVIKALARAGTKNPIILLDEIDRVTEEARNDIMGVLVELLDPEQNHSFLDHYLDYPFDLSQTLFIGTANGTSHIATAVLDRMEPISMPSYSDTEKTVIAQKYLLPKILKETALPDGVLNFTDDVWPQLVRPLGYDAGIRTLQRTLQGVVRKVAKEFVEGKIQNLTLTMDNLKPYLPSYKTELI